ncbi:Hypothetical predicted protein [Mytilus galloprovincialis]|nr:Hypothetical predicted protein [Mytilus galloprovincialis]
MTFNTIRTFRRPLHHSSADVLLPAQKELFKDRIHHYIYENKGYELQAVNAGVPCPSQMTNPILPGQSFSDHSKVYLGWRSPQLSFFSSSIFLKGYMALKLYLHGMVRPNHIPAFRALERFFSEKERHGDCLSRYLQKERSLTEPKVACVFTQHFLSQLLPHPTNFILDTNAKGKSAECPCGCGAPMLYGTTLVGSHDLFYGNADIVLFPSDKNLSQDAMNVMETSSIITTPQYSFEKEFEEDDIDGDEFAEKDLSDIMSDETTNYDQVLMQAISVSLCQHKQLKNKKLTKNNISAVPICQITKDTYCVALYDARYDYLMRTNKPLNLFDGNSLRFDAVLDLWLLIQHNLFCSTPHQKILKKIKGTCDLIPQLGRDRFEKIVQNSRFLYMPENMHPENTDDVSVATAKDVGELNWLDILTKNLDPMEPSIENYDSWFDNWNKEAVEISEKASTVSHVHKKDKWDRQTKSEENGPGC